MPPRLTIAIPTLNRASLLGRAIESALAQTSPDIEILVSDNASTDDTPRVLERFAGRGLRTFRQPTTINAARHGTFLMQQARGEFFLGLSDDDYLEPEFAAEVLALFDSHPELSFVYTGCYVHYEDTQVPAVVGPPIESGPDFLMAHYNGLREVSWCACVTRVKDLLEIGPQPDDRTLGDMFFWTKLAFRGPVGCVSRTLSHYILLRPPDLNDNISHATSVASWACESRLLTDETLESARRAGLGDDYLTRFRAASRRHVARSAANQFIWRRIRGASIIKALTWIPESVPYLNMNLPVIARIGAALLLPRSVLRSRLLRGAHRLAIARTQGPHHADS
jgi:glycosyltransferase involved in cell wall biosynthesis